MDSAKAAVKDFMARSGHHDTTVHEKVAPAVTHESHQLQQHEQIQTAIDKEVHQDHYHTSIQPVKDREVLPEQHHHNLAAVEHRSFEHGNDSQVKERLAAEAAQFRDQRTEVEAVHSKSIAPTIGGEHIHHHVHETIQPVINKETIEPHVVHTTVPIHEVHHNAAQHHTASALPAVSMADFKKQGGVLTGREERYDGFEGEPRTVGGSHTSTTGISTGTGLTGSHSTHSHGSHGSHGHGLTGSNTTGTGLTGSNTTGRETLGERVREGERDLKTGHSHSTTGTTGAGYGSSTTGHNSEIDSKTGKPSLMDKLNPMKDSDHDGKKGMMD
ncbi:hypothetical protein D6D13_04306 [Aureobasidium pullulans]|uniref:Allergen n=1 Tax=Aureobasidium pullulans TaxID=5580 RepID=A0A4S9CX89_AURPU|nr:hypothetical protein D6D13_04306 [Aureobasidium pullulans]